MKQQMKQSFWNYCWIFHGFTDGDDFLELEFVDDFGENHIFIVLIPHVLQISSCTCTTAVALRAEPI